MTLAISTIGAVVGAVLGAVALLGVILVIGGPRSDTAPPLVDGGIIGGILGFVLAPVAAWTLMRHVPLWRAITETALGTAIGVAAGLLIGVRLQAPLWPIGLGLVGFTAAAIRLRLSHRGTERAVSGSDVPDS